MEIWCQFVNVVWYTAVINIQMSQCVTAQLLMNLWWCQVFSFCGIILPKIIDVRSTVSDAKWIYSNKIRFYKLMETSGICLLCCFHLDSKYRKYKLKTKFWHHLHGIFSSLQVSRISDNSQSSSISESMSIGLILPSLSIF